MARWVLLIFVSNNELNHPRCKYLYKNMKKVKKSGILSIKHYIHTILILYSYFSDTSIMQQCRPFSHIIEYVAIQLYYILFIYFLLCKLVMLQRDNSQLGVWDYWPDYGPEMKLGWRSDISIRQPDSSYLLRFYSVCTGIDIFRLIRFSELLEAPQ